ncbi:MAG: flavodoxin family protein [Oscillospiraceae bacterium]|nr:flavodoxin family protein [Oscillospiraceae bacterium]
MKTLIINGSPRKNGDTAFLISKLKEFIEHETIEISAYYDNINPCIDCRACKVKKGCAINDKMKLVYDGDFDNVVIASPLYMSNLTSPLIGIASRFQAFYCAKRFLKDEFILREKKAALILVGGGDGGPERAIGLSQWIFKKLNARGFENHMVFSLKTDDIPAMKDKEAIKRVQEIALYFNTV